MRDEQDAPTDKTLLVQTNRAANMPPSVTPRIAQRSVGTELMDEGNTLPPDMQLNQDDSPLLIQTEPEQQTEQPVPSLENRHPKLSDEYEQASLSIRQRGERLMNRMMSNNTFETNKLYN